MTVKNNQEELETLFRRVCALKRRKKRPLSFEEVCDFISAVSGMKIETVRHRLLDVSADP